MATAVVVVMAAVVLLDDESSSRRLQVHIQIYLSTFCRNKKEKKPEWMDESPEKRDEE